MRAINLIPAEAGRGGASRSGTGTYALLGVLALAVACISAYVLTSNTVVEREAKLASLRTQVAAAQSQAEATRSYREFAALAAARVQTVRQLGEARFDWHRSLRDFSKVVPDNVWLTSLLGTVAPGVTAEGAASGATNGMRSSIPNPALELTGCTTSHEGVVRLISRLRLMTGVTRVALADSSKEDGGGGGGDCRYGNRRYPLFQLVVFFEPIAGVVAPAVSSSTTTPAATSTPSSGEAAPGSDLR